MMTSSNKPKIHHYVPQFLLRKFGTGKKGQLYVFDKQSGKSFRTIPRNVAAESKFYDFEHEGIRLSVEPSLSVLESEASKVIEKLLVAKNVRELSGDNRLLLGKFLSVQKTRTRAYREMTQVMWDDVQNLWKESARSEEELMSIEENINPGNSKNQKTMNAVQHMNTAIERYTPHFVDKVWVLIKTDNIHPFCIGDNPVVLENNLNSKTCYGNIGLAVKGIEIYFPLTPKYALAMWCSSIEESVRRAVNNSRRSTIRNPSQVAQNIHNPLGLEQIMEAFDTGRPFQYQPENVVRFNSLQIARAERFVYSHKDDFSLAREMIGDNPDLRRGPRVEIT